MMVVHSHWLFTQKRSGLVVLHPSWFVNSYNFNYTWVLSACQPVWGKKDRSVLSNWLIASLMSNLYFLFTVLIMSVHKSKGQMLRDHSVFWVKALFYSVLCSHASSVVGNERWDRTAVHHFGHYAAVMVGADSGDRSPKNTFTHNGIFNLCGCFSVSNGLFAAISEMEETIYVCY